MAVARRHVSSVGEGAVPLFFFSYSRNDAVDPYLRRFYEDLRLEVSTRGGIDVDDAGFLDRDQPVGTQWPRTTGDALGACRVFVPIYSPHYFNSHICGQEWHAFSSRIATSPGPAGGRTQSIVPVWWVPPVGDPPAVAEHLQDTRDQFDAEYREFGLRYLMQLKENEGRYRDFLVRFTMKILTAAAYAPPATAIADLLHEPNAFAAVSSDDRVRRRPPRTCGSGPRKVTFVIAAAGQEDMTAIRTAVDVYGDDWADWRPYHPHCPDPVAVRAQGVAAAQRMISGLIPADGSLRTLLERAPQHSELVVLIVDPWVAGLPAYGHVLSEVNGIRSGNAVVLAPWEPLDALPDPELERARDLLYVSLSNWMDDGDRAFRDDIRSIADFENILGQALVEVRARIVSRDAVAHRVTETGPRSRPILTGPEADDEG